MPRFSDDELTRLKAIPLLELCRDYGIELRAAGKDWKGRCPFHDDDGPSFVVTPGKNLWNCLGQCGSGGDTIALVMKKEGVSFRHACEKLRARLGAAPPAATITTRIGTSHDALATPEEASDDATLLGKVADFYHRTFCNEPAAMRYLQSRACFHPEAVTTFRLGYANRTLGYRVPPVETVAGRELKARLTALGVIRKSTGHEHLNGCVVFPLFDAAGRVVQLYGRRLNVTTKQGRHFYLERPKRGLWNAAGLLPGAEWLLTEALIDGLTLWAHGWRNVTASYGVNSFTQDHWALLDERKPPRVVIGYDHDPAGEAQTAPLAKELAARGVEAWRLMLPRGKDINDVAREADDPPAALRRLIDGARKIAGPVVVAVPSLESADTRAPASSSLAAKEAAKEEAASPAATHSDPLAVAKNDHEETVLVIDGREYRVRGLAKNTGFETLKVSLRVACNGCWHLDTIDLAQAKQRAAFVAAVSEETGLKPDALKRDVGRVLLKLEELQEQRLRAQVAAPAEPEIPPALRARAEALLRDPKLLDRILADLTTCGLIGEDINKLVTYLAAVSRLLDRPLAVIIRALSAAGKSWLMDSALSLAPANARVQYSALTGQALFYMGGATDLRHKILAIVEEEGAEKASYALKLLQSEGALSIAATGKNPATGRMETQEYRVEGPVAIFLTTTAVDLDEELLNRCLVLTVDESREQTAAIHAAQRRAETLAGLRTDHARAELIALHQAAQRLLRPLRVVNPWAEQLTFPDECTRTRRDHKKYLALIRVIALLHQYQRRGGVLEEHGRAVEYIEATLDDIAVANRLAHHVLGRSLDEMPPQSRRLLELIERMVAERSASTGQAREALRFRARAVREYTGWGHSQLYVHLQRLVALEYLIPHRADQGQGVVYELLYDGAGQDGRRFLCGLLDVEKLRSQQTGNTECVTDRPGQKSDCPAPFRPDSGPFPGDVRGEGKRDSSSENMPGERADDENAQPGGHADAA